MREGRAPLVGVDRALADIAGIGLVIMMVMTVGSSLSRFLFNTPIPDVEAVAEMLLVGVVFLGFAYTQALGQHVQVTLFTERLSAKAKHRLDVFGYLVGIGAFSVLLYALFTGAQTAWQTGDAYLGVNLIQTWPARSLAVFGLAAMLLRLIVNVVCLVFSDAGTRDGVRADEEPESQSGV